MTSVDIRSDTPELIREIQEYLRALAYYDPRIPTVSADGVYGKETTNAVRRFQQISGLPETGTVDPQTWDDIYLAYRALKTERQSPVRLSVFSAPSYVIRPGERNQIMFFLQMMLNAIAERYHNVTAVALTGIYDQATSNSVKELQRIFGLEQTETINRNTWDAIATVYNNLSENNPLN